MRTWLTLALTLCVVAQLAADEGKVPFDKLPKEVKASFEKHFPGAAFKNAATEKDEGKLVYEIAFVHNHAKIDATFDPGGKLLDVEKEIQAKDLPKAAAETLGAKYAGATLKKVEELSKDGRTPTGYEVLLVTSAKQTIEVRMDTEGKVTGEEKKGK